MAAESAVNKNIYGISGTDSDISADVAAYNAAAPEDKEKIAEAKAKVYGVTVDAFKEAAEVYSKDWET
jgi:hypothetical protein